jgi:hypothetical protein
MESGALPWEASRPLLDFLNRKSWADVLQRPTNGVARWYWRLYQVARPGGDESGDEQGEELDRIELMAIQLAGDELSRVLTDQVKRSIEGWLACKGWTEDGEQLYYARVSQGLYPIAL